jgi:hypothetical protein
LFYAEKLAPGQTRDDVVFQAEPPEVPLKEAACKPGGT